MGLGEQGLGLVAGEVGDGDPELDVEGEAAFGVLGQGDQGGDGGLAGGELLYAGDRGEGVVEAGGVAGGEQLLGVGALAGAPDLFGGVDWT